MDFTSTAVFPQILLSLIVMVVVFILYMTSEQIYAWWNKVQYIKVPLQVKTTVKPKMRIFKQNRCTGLTDIPNGDEVNAYCPASESQLTGIEFSYVLFVKIDPETDDSTLGWKGVFWKGYPDRPFPLLGPGVFVTSNNADNGAPTLRVVMNTYDRWFNAIDVLQIPFRKWFHLAIVLRKNTLEVYVNGNLANKQTLKGTLPYQNYQPVVTFPVANSMFGASKQDFNNTEGSGEKMGIPPGDNMVYNGPVQGSISNMFYYSYALTYSEIMANMNIGPNKEVETDRDDIPPYFIDSWWSGTKG